MITPSHTRYSTINSTDSSDRDNANAVYHNSNSTSGNSNVNATSNSSCIISYHIIVIAAYNNSSNDSSNGKDNISNRATPTIAMTTTILAYPTVLPKNNT